MSTSSVEYIKNLAFTDTLELLQPCFVLYSSSKQTPCAAGSQNFFVPAKAPPHSVLQYVYIYIKYVLTQISMNGIAQHTVVIYRILGDRYLCLL